MALSAIQRKAESFVGRYRSAFARAFTEGQKATSATKIEKALTQKNTHLAELEAAKGIAKVDEVLRGSLPELILNLVAAAGNVAGSELPTPPKGDGPVVMRARPLQPSVRFDKTNPDAITWAANYASDLVRDITAESRDAINHVIAQRLASGASTRETAKVIQMSVALSEPHARAVQILNEKLLASPGKTVRAGSLVFRVPPTGMTSKELDAALTKYAGRLTKTRAKLIARTATRNASSEGQRQMWRQARTRGLLSGTEKRMWIASKNACPVCSALDGETTSLEGMFNGQFHNPPAHGNCECTQSLTYD